MFKIATRTLIVIGALWCIAACDDSEDFQDVETSEDEVVASETVKEPCDADPERMGKKHRKHRKGPPDFEQIDQDGDGYLTVAELTRPDQRIRKLDADNDGSVSRAEFEEGIARHKAKLDEMKQAHPRVKKHFMAGKGLEGKRQRREPPSFDALDKNADGLLSAEELARPSRHLDRMDTDNDQRISRAEFDTFVAKHKAMKAERGRGEFRRARPAQDAI